MEKKLSASASIRATPIVTLKPTINPNALFKVSLYQNAKIVGGNVISIGLGEKQAATAINIFPASSTLSL